MTDPALIEKGIVATPGTTSYALTVGVTAPHVFEVGALLSGSSSIQALPVLGAFGYNASIPLNETMYRSRSDIPSLELKLGL